MTDAVDIKTDLGVALEQCGGFGRYQITLMLKIYFCALSSIAIVNSATLAMPAIICQISMNNSAISLIFGGLFIGMISGGFVWGVITDVIGRKKTLLILLALTWLAESSSAFSITYWHLFANRIILGLVASGIMATTYTYTNEFVSIKHKDLILMRTGMMMASGYLVQPILAWLIMPRDIDLFMVPFTNNKMEFNNWRVFFICNGLISLFGFLCLITSDESPAYYIKVGKQNLALSVLEKIYVRNTGKDVESFPVKKVYLYEIPAKGESKSTLSKFISLILPPIGVSFVVAVLSQSITMGSYTSLRAHMPILLDVSIGIGQNNNVTKTQLSFCELFSKQNLFSRNEVKCHEKTTPSITYIYIFIMGFCVTTSYILVTIIVKKIGKPVMFVSLHTIAGICALAVPFSMGYLTVMCLICFVACLQNSQTLAVSLIVNRVPTNIRGLAVTLVLIGGRCAIFIGGFELAITTRVSCFFGFAVIASMNFISWPLMLIYATQKNTIEELERKRLQEHDDETLINDDETVQQNLK